jgi:hypothetical protein
MTAIQICALIGLTLAAAFVYWIGYRGGLTDGQVKGEEQGKKFALDTTNTIIRELESELRFMRTDHWHLSKECETLKGTRFCKKADLHLPALRELESELRFQQVDRWHLAKANEQLKAAQAFGANERQTLLATAEKLRLAADTFRAMSSTGQAKQALELRDKVLDMIALLQPTAQERAA